ncbi:beta-N-acetylhexosaminidase [candidate division KSB1 bacterium]|nr:beta-N-acetylhexosaminidase [candidate division KSB1 bacterium]
MPSLKIVPQYVFFVLATLILIVMACASRQMVQIQQMETDIIPKPMVMTTDPGSVHLTDSFSILCDTDDKELEGLSSTLYDWCKKFLDLELHLKSTKQASESKQAIRLTLQKMDPVLGKEGYQLDVTDNGVTLQANTGAGLFYGLQTLIQLFPATQTENGIQYEAVLPFVHITDKPRFSWRGMHLDVCRHFFPVSFIKRYIDLLAMHKMNTFHWHLTEDQGWRIEIKQYPRLTEIGAWRVDREHQNWSERTPPEPGEQATYGGFYTQDDIREVIKYARKRYITVVPEIEMPGHAVAALAAYPELSCTGGPFYVMPGGYWPITNIYCAGKDTVFKFLENVLEEVAALFPGEYIHIGGDEAFKDNWEKCSDCQARIKANGLKDEHELQSYFIKRIEEFLISKNKKLIGWDEILEGGLAPEATVMSWRGMDGGIIASKAGHDVVMSPTTHCYLDYYQSEDQEAEPVAIGGYLPLDSVYAFDPMPPELEPSRQHHILGAQCNVWTEYMPNGNHVEYMALPRLCALSEVVWSPREQRHYEDFLRRLSVHYKRLDALDVNYRNHETGKAAKPTPKTYYSE